MKFKQLIKYSFAFLIIITITTCSQKSELALAFKCSNTKIESDLKYIDDIHKNYRISYPKHWKSSLYFDEYQSDIYLADTTKSLTSTYILNISQKKGNIEFNDDLKEKLYLNSQNQQLEILAYNQFNFINSPAIYVHSKGFRNNFSYQQINILKPSINSFFDIKIELYGDETIDNRLCEAIHYINLLQELK